MENINGFEIDVYNQYGIKENATTWTCPVCSEHRKPINQKQKCMSVFWDTGLGQCNHCGERVQLHTYKKKNSNKTYKLPQIRQLEVPYSPHLLRWFKEVRGISESVLKRLKIGEGKKWMPKAQKEIEVIEFRYYLFGKLINIKYRGKNKDFMFEKECELIMYNIDSITFEKECWICEGEADVAAFVEAGIDNVVSVPNGFTLPKKDGKSSINLSYIDDYYSFFENKEKIYIAVDNDEAGRHGRDELVRRFGSDKCWIIDFGDCKDANEYLLKYGAEKLANLHKEAKQVPIEYVETLSDYESELDDFFLNGCPKGFITGIKNLDDNYSIEFGQYCVVVAPPQSGKSEVVDAICLGYAFKYDFKTAFASPENKPNKFHTAKIIKKIIGYTPSTEYHIKSRDYKLAKEFYNDHFYHVEVEYELDKVLDKFKELVRRRGVRVFVIDPYNKIRLKGFSSNQVNEYTLEYLNKIDRFCKEFQAIIYLVVHPVKMQKKEGTDSYVMPDAYSIKGGGEFFDMAYHIIGLTKDKERKLVECKTLKVKFQHLGSPDVTFYLGWNINNGRYVSIDFDPVDGRVPEVVWDNSSYFAENKPIEQPQIQEYIDPIRNMRGNIETAFKDDNLGFLDDEDVPAPF